MLCMSRAQIHHFHGLREQNEGELMADCRQLQEVFPTKRCPLGWAGDTLMVERKGKRARNSGQTIGGVGRADLLDSILHGLLAYDRCYIHIMVA
jgi:hypothetical protein